MRGILGEVSVLAASVAVEVSSGTATSVDALEARSAADVFLLGCGVRRNRASTLMADLQIAVAQVQLFGGKADGISLLLDFIAGLGGHPVQRGPTQQELEAMREIDAEVAAQAAWMADPKRIHAVWSEHGSAVVRGFLGG